MVPSFPDHFLVPCRDLDEAVAAVSELGFRLEMILPADSPTTVVISKDRFFIRLERASRGFSADVITSLLGSDNPESVLAGKRFTKRPLVFGGERNEVLREPVFSGICASSSWNEGRAGMLYRDLIPGRLGGAFVGSHIKITSGGPVPDRVHYHEIRFQIIFCRRGWVKVVYEDQGDPFILNEGDCVLQPPEIRHRVLESSENLEVIEIGSPAVHSTFIEHELVLPNPNIDRQRLFGSQKFVRFVFKDTEWSVSKGFLSKETGVGAATSGIGDVKIVRNEKSSSRNFSHSFEFLFWYVLKGEIQIDGFDAVGEDESVVIPKDSSLIVNFSDSCEFLEVCAL